MMLKKRYTLLIVLFLFLVTVFTVEQQTEAEVEMWELEVRGLVDHPHNFTLPELQSFPMTSEVAAIECVEGGVELANWTGIPLLALFNITGVQTGALEVVFYAIDGFSSSLPVEEALQSTTLLALRANGTMLSNYGEYGDHPPNRLVAPCKWGYKWVKWITMIEVVDYDYKGTYEREGYPDEADNPHCVFPRPHNVAIKDLILSRTIVVRESSVLINVSAMNYGGFTETFNVTVFINTTPVETVQNIILTSPNTTTLSIVWNTTEVPCGNYAITANASLVPDEQNTLDNTKTTWAVITIVGDGNGDFRVGYEDVGLIAAAYGSTPVSGGWNDHVDFNQDDKIGYKDLGILATSYGQHCQS